MEYRALYSYYAFLVYTAVLPRSHPPRHRTQAIECFEYAVASMGLRLGTRPLWLLLSEWAVARIGAAWGDGSLWADFGGGGRRRCRAARVTWRCGWGCVWKMIGGGCREVVGGFYNRGCFLWEEEGGGDIGIASSGTDRGFALSVGEKA